MNTLKLTNVIKEELKRQGHEIDDVTIASSLNGRKKISLSITINREEDIDKVTLNFSPIKATSFSNNEGTISTLNAEPIKKQSDISKLYDELEKEKARRNDLSFKL